jgi:hypothetical protein
MKRLLLILIFTLSLQSWTKADDISDFSIEGFSIGDTLLRYFSEDQIKNKAKTILTGGKEYHEWKQVYIENKNIKYERISLYFKNDDKNYIIKKIAAKNYYENNINECYDLQVTIVNELEMILQNTEKVNLKKVKHPAFPEGNSYQTSAYFDFTDGSYVGVTCLDFSSEDTPSRDRLSITIITKEYATWLNSESKK